MTEINDPAIARKRRKAIIQSQRSEAEQPVVSGNEAAMPTEDVPTNNVRSNPKTAEKRKATATQNQVGDFVEKKRKSQKLGQSLCSPEGILEDQLTEAGKKKTQIRYDPDVPMSKEQLAAWRREARRVRNRESAAASRQRIRNRISELEDEVNNWKKKYTEAMQRLQSLEKASATPTTGPSPTESGS